MKRIFSLVLLTLSALAVSAQIYNPVKWNFTAKHLGGDNYELQFAADIEDTWHLYAAHLSSDEGPVATNFQFEKGAHYKLQGDIKDGNTITKYDKVFEMDLAYYENKAVFTQKVIWSGSEPITGELEFMVCTEERCLPPEFVPFSISKDGSAADDSKSEQAPKENKIFNPVKWKIEMIKLDEFNYEMVFTATIEKGWHLYSQNLPGEDGPIATSFTFNEQEGLSKVGKTTEPKPILKYDPNFMMDLTFFEGEVSFKQKFSVDGSVKSISGAYEYMVCDEERCLPPEWVEFDINLDGTSNMPVEDALADSDGKQLRITGVDLDNPVNDCEIEGAIVKETKSNWNIFFLGFVGGLIALLTPCVFPMIPLTVSFFTKGGSAGASGIGESVMYGFFIFLIYILLSLPFHFLDSIDPEILNTISTNVYLNVAFFVIFVFFAISFFGYFEITLPAKFTNSVDQKSDVGGILGTFFMALTLALVSFSCTGPILGSLLAGSLTASGGAMQLTTGMGGFGLALALPFGLFAAFPGWLKNLPKSGGWLNTVKVVLGFIELALAIKFLSNADLVAHWGLLKRELFFALWIIIGAGLFLYLIGAIKFPHDSKLDKLSWGRKGFAVAVLAFTIYLIPGLTNTKYANLNLISGFPPPLFYSYYEQANNCPLGIQCFKDYEEGMAYAKANNKPVMLDFTGWACVNCRKMEENVWVDKDIYKTLNEDYVLISLYVDDRKELPNDQQFVYETVNGNKKKIKTVGNKWATLQTETFQNNSQPFYALISPEGELLNNPVGYTPNKATYQEFLNCGLEAFSGGAVAQK